MANEAVLRYAESAAGNVIQDYTCSDSTGIEKGTLLKISDARTVAASNVEGGPCAGIAAREKIASDGRTQIAVYKRGYFDMTASGAITVGEAVFSKGHDNCVCSISGAATLSGAAVIGYAEETASNGEVFIVRLNL